MGGSFDPVHLGHLIIAQDAIEQLHLDELILIPAASAPHKQGIQQLDAECRLEMLRLAVEGCGDIRISDLEISRGGVSYTVDTVRHFTAVHPEIDWYLVIGSDTLVDLHNWYKIDELLGMCKVASFLRPDESSKGGLADKIGLPDALKKQVLEHVFSAHLIELSSTEIRKRAANGLSIRNMVPPTVEHYIIEHGLYQD